MSRKPITAKNAAAVGPYSHGVESNGFVFLSGQTPLDQSTGKLAEGTIEAQTKQCFVNLFAVLEAAGLTPADVVKCNVFLTDMNDFAAMNKIYGEQFEQPFPARTTIGAASLPLGAQIEIEMIAAKH
jgi:2-iminobutanoate/2-iminopropanoate deaminase